MPHFHRGPPPIPTRLVPNPHRTARGPRWKCGKLHQKGRPRRGGAAASPTAAAVSDPRGRPPRLDRMSWYHVIRETNYKISARFKIKSWPGAVILYQIIYLCSSVPGLNGRVDRIHGVSMQTDIFYIVTLSVGRYSARPCRSVRFISISCNNILIIVIIPVTQW